MPDDKTAPFFVSALCAAAMIAMTGCPKGDPVKTSRPNASSSQNKTAGGLLAPGQPAPKITLVAHTGKPVALDEYKGRKVLLWFYPKANTGG